MPKTEKARADDHSKRLREMEVAQLHFGNQMSQLGADMRRVKEVLFGGDNPNEIPMRIQVAEINEAVKKIAERMDKADEETVRIRQEGFGRIKELESKVRTLEDDKKDARAEMRKWLFWLVTAFAGGAMTRFLGW